MLALEQELEKQRLGLNKILGVGPETHVRLRRGSWFYKNRNHLPAVIALN